MESRNSISMLLEQTANAFGTRASKQLQPYGITYTQTLVLCLLVNTFGGSCLQSELRKEMGVSGPALSGILKRLEKCGFVVKADDPMDTRKNRVSASDKAFECMPALTACLEACEKQALSGLCAAEIDMLMEDFLRILENCTKEKTVS